jgi:hypothetical protein
MPERHIIVRVHDADTDELLQEASLKDDYVLICAGNRYLKSQQTVGATHMLAVAVRKADASTEAPDA